MFVQYPFIEKQHYVALESAIRNHGVVTTVNAQVLAQMYKLARSGLEQPIIEAGFFTSHLRDGKVTLSSVTEMKSGLWIQLAKIEGQPAPLLALGQKWAQENYLPALGNTSSVFW